MTVSHPLLPSLTKRFVYLLCGKKHACLPCLPTPSVFLLGTLGNNYRACDWSSGRNTKYRLPRKIVLCVPSCVGSMSIPLSCPFIYNSCFRFHFFMLHVCVGGGGGVNWNRLLTFTYRRIYRFFDGWSGRGKRCWKALAEAWPRKGFGEKSSTTTLVNKFIWLSTEHFGGGQYMVGIGMYSCCWTLLGFELSKYRKACFFACIGIIWRRGMCSSKPTFLRNHPCFWS